MKVEITISLPYESVKNIIEDYVIENFGQSLGVTKSSELEWDDYSLMVTNEERKLTFSKAKVVRTTN